MDSLTDNTSPSETPPAISLTPRPVKVVRIARFLPTAERDALYEASCANQAVFQAPGIPGSEIGASRYLSLEAEENDPEGAGPVREASECLSKRILERLPDLCATLGVEPFAISEFPLTFIHGLDGHSGSPHADSLDGRHRISLLYYFHRTPKMFRGGDLELYETDPGSPAGHAEEALTRIDYEDNLLLAFPSETYHGVTEVHCDSDDFADGRFVVVGFLSPR